MARTVLVRLFVCRTMHPFKINPTARRSGSALSGAPAVLMLRWTLIIATSYLVVFSRPLGTHSTSAALFVAGYFASNILLTELLPHFRSQYAFDIGIVLLDTVMVSVGLLLTQSASSEFYVVYFIIMFLSALTERLGLVLGAALLIAGAQLYTESRFVGWEELITPGHMLRVPFLFVVALFFGHLVQDARRRERWAEESRARERRMEFLSGVSHDLKNPLGVVQSLATLLLDGEAGSLSEQQVDLVRRIHASTGHVITFAFNLIDSARIEAGRLILHRSPVSVPDLVEDTLVLARSAAQLKGITLRCAIEPSLPAVEIDRVQMERVISNLVGNAIKFTQRGGTVGVSAALVGNRLVLAVCDDGPGIPTAELRAMFEKYHRQVRSSRTEGSGLGLFIAKAIVEAHGGAIAIDSTVGQGTTVTVRLPIGAPGAAEPPEPRRDRSKRKRWWPFGMHARAAPVTLPGPTRPRH